MPGYCQAQLMPAPACRHYQYRGLSLNRRNSISKAFKAAEIFPPGDFLREELEARGWTQSDLAKVIGRPLQVVNEIIKGKKRITAQTAKAIGLAFGTSAELWLNLETTYQLSVVPDPDPAISKRAAALESAA